MSARQRWRGSAYTELDKHFSNVVRRLGRRLKVSELVLARIRLALMCRNRAVLLEVTFVRRERHDNIGLSIELELTHPALGALERLEGGHVVRDDGGLGAAVVHRREGLEALRARRVPDPKLDLVIRVLLRHRALQERRAYRRHLVGVEYARTLRYPHLVRCMPTVSGPWV